MGVVGTGRIGTVFIIALHAPLTSQTHRLVDRERLARVKPGVMIVNTSRGGLVDTEAAIEAMKDGRVGYLGLDVYEEEDAIGFFEEPVRAGRHV